MKGVTFRGGSELTRLLVTYTYRPEDPSRAAPEISTNSFLTFVTMEIHMTFLIPYTSSRLRVTMSMIIVRLK